MTREEMLAVAKPILFNTEMVRAVKDNRKTATRRVVKPQPTYSPNYGFSWKGAAYGTDLPPTEKGAASNFRCAAPYRTGDILYVPERWKSSPDSQLWDDGEYRVVFPDGEVVWFYFENPKRAEKWQKYIDKPLNNWQSPYFMPKEAARIFLRVTDVRVERLQDIDDEGAKSEGANWRNGKNVGLEEKIRRSAVERFSEIWDSTIKPADLALYGWDSNPWVWVIEFEKMEAEK